MRVAKALKRMRERSSNKTAIPISVRMDPQMLKNVRRVSEQHGVAMSAIFRELCEIAWPIFTEEETQDDG